MNFPEKKTNLRKISQPYQPIKREVSDKQDGQISKFFNSFRQVQEEDAPIYPSIYQQKPKNQSSIMKESDLFDKQQYQQIQNDRRKTQYKSGSYLWMGSGDDRNNRILQELKKKNQQSQRDQMRNIPNGRKFGKNQSNNFNQNKSTQNRNESEQSQDQIGQSEILNRSRSRSRNINQNRVSSREILQQSDIKDLAQLLGFNDEDDEYNETIDKRINQRQLNISKFIRQNMDNTLSDDIETLKSMLQQIFLRNGYIQRMKTIIASRFLYFPSKLLVNTLLKDGKQYDSLIFKTVAMRHGDLYQISRNFDPQLKTEVNHIIKYVLNWGNYYIDLKKLQKIATQKSGDSNHKIYLISPYELEFHIKTKNINIVSVSYQGKFIEPTQFKFKILQTLAQKKARDIATQIFYKFIKSKQNS